MNECNWRLIDVSGIPSVLVSRVTGFGESPEYANLRHYELDIPGVVCGALARYVCRLFLAKTGAADNQLRIALDVLENLSSSSNPQVVDLMATEVVENLDLNKEQMMALKSMSGTKIGELIEKWTISMQS